jgi:hypothetical protein
LSEKRRTIAFRTKNQELKFDSNLVINCFKKSRVLFKKRVDFFKGVYQTKNIFNRTLKYLNQKKVCFYESGLLLLAHLASKV